MVKLILSVLGLLQGTIIDYFLLLHYVFNPRILVFCSLKVASAMKEILTTMSMT